MAQPKKPLTECDLIFVDIETSGLDPSIHSILQVAGLRVEQSTLKIVGEYSSYVRPMSKDHFRFEPRALEVNKIDPFSPEMQAAPFEAQALVGLAELMRGTVLIAQNPTFDLSFLRPAFNRNSLPMATIDYHALDTASMIGWPLVQTKQIKTSSLKWICEYFKITNDGAHDAMADCRRTLAVYAEYLRRMKSLNYRIRYLRTGIPF